MIRYNIDQESLTQQYFWVGISSASDSMSMAHMLNNALNTNWQKVKPLLSSVSNGKKTEHPLYLDYTDEECISLLLQNNTVQAQLMPSWSTFDYILLYPKSHLSSQRLNGVIGEVEIVFQHFLMPDFQQMNKLYQRNVECLSELLELYFLQARHSLFIEDYNW